MTGQQSIKEWTDYPLSFFCKKSHLIKWDIDIINVK